MKKEKQSYDEFDVAHIDRIATGLAASVTLRFASENLSLKESLAAFVGVVCKSALTISYASGIEPKEIIKMISETSESFFKVFDDPLAKRNAEIIRNEY